MRPLVLSALFLTVLAPGFSQTAADAGSSPAKEPRAVLDAALPFYDFSSPELKPWHLKANYELYDLKGKPTEQGTWEYWWASPKVYRSNWKRADAEATEWSTAEGAVYRKVIGSPLRYFERTIEETLLSPLPGRGVLDSGRMKLDLRMLPADKPEFPCVFATLQWVIDGKLQAPSSGLPQEYCFEPATMALRIAYSDQLTKQYNHLVKTQGRYLARQVVFSYGKQTLFTVSVDTIEDFNPTDAAFSPPADAILERHVTTPQDVATGSLVKKTIPVYPLTSRMNHEQGVVVLAAVIGTDGRVHDLEVLASPSSMLSQSAVDAVKTWEYKPYLLNGQPFEVETIVNVTYSLAW
jgi:TonB family protein